MQCLYNTKPCFSEAKRRRSKKAENSSYKELEQEVSVRQPCARCVQLEGAKDTQLPCATYEKMVLFTTYAWRSSPFSDSPSSPIHEKKKALPCPSLLIALE